MIDLVSITTQPWKKKQDQEKLMRSLQKDLFVEKDSSEMTTLDIFNKLRSLNG